MAASPVLTSRTCHVANCIIAIIKIKEQSMVIFEINSEIIRQYTTAIVKHSYHQYKYLKYILPYALMRGT